jgi:hypothetical protein
MIEVDEGHQGLEPEQEVQEDEEEKHELHFSAESGVAKTTTTFVTGNSALLLGATTLTITTFAIATFCITSLCIKGLYVTLSISNTQKN